MQCPFDATTLQVVNRSGVEIDWCPSCKGVWLERGELDKLIDQAGALMAPAPVMPPPAPVGRVAAPSPAAAPAYGDGRRRDWDDDDWDDDDRHKYAGGHRPKKRKNLLSEIFDF